MITITAKITKDVRTFAAGDSTGFSMLLGKQYFDYQTKQKVWTNYKVTLFAKDKQAQFYQDSLIQGAIVDVYAEDCKVDLYNPEYPNIELINARLSNVFSGQQSQQQAKQPVQQNQQPQNQNNPPPIDDMNDSLDSLDPIPF